MPSGRKSKVVEWNLGDKIRDLRKQGYSYAETARIMNKEKEHPNIPDITKDVIWRWEKSPHHKPVDRAEIVDQFNHLVNDIGFKIGMIDTIDRNTKTELRRWIRNMCNGFRRHLKNLARQSPEVIEDRWKDQFNTFLTGMSNVLCSDCRSEINRLVGEYLDIRPELDTINPNRNKETHKEEK